MATSFRTFAARKALFEIRGRRESFIRLQEYRLSRRRYFCLCNDSILTHLRPGGIEVAMEPSHYHLLGCCLCLLLGSVFHRRRIRCPKTLDPFTAFGNEWDWFCLLGPSSSICRPSVRKSSRILLQLMPASSYRFGALLTGQLPHIHWLAILHELQYLTWYI